MKKFVDIYIRVSIGILSVYAVVAIIPLEPFEILGSMFAFGAIIFTVMALKRQRQLLASVLIAIGVFIFTWTAFVSIGLRGSARGLVWLLMDNSIGVIPYIIFADTMPFLIIAAIFLYFREDGNGENIDK